MTYSKDIADILSPWKRVLQHLFLHEMESVKDNLIPARDWLQRNRKPVNSTLLPYVASLPVTERLQISNWFESHISKDPQFRHEWMGLLPIAHAHTVYIAHRLQ